MYIGLRLSTTATRLAIWMANNPLAGRLMGLALPLALTFAVGLYFGQPIYRIWAPPCGSGSGGGGPC